MARNSKNNKDKEQKTLSEKKGEKKMEIKIENEKNYWRVEVSGTGANWLRGSVEQKMGAFYALSEFAACELFDTRLSQPGYHIYLGEKDYIGAIGPNCPEETLKRFHLKSIDNWKAIVRFNGRLILEDFKSEEACWKHDFVDFLLMGKHFGFIWSMNLKPGWAEKLISTIQASSVEEARKIRQDSLDSYYLGKTLNGAVVRIYRELGRTEARAHLANNKEAINNSVEVLFNGELTPMSELPIGTLVVVTKGKAVKQYRYTGEGGLAIKVKDALERQCTVRAIKN